LPRDCCHGVCAHFAPIAAIAELFSSSPGYARREAVFRAAIAGQRRQPSCCRLSAAFEASSFASSAFSQLRFTIRRDCRQLSMIDASF